MPINRQIIFWFLVGCVFMSSFAWAHSDNEHDGGKKPTHYEGHAVSGTSKVALGETVYKHMCIFCHGADGNGGGKATAYLYPWPRDFRKGIFKHRTTPP